LFHALTIRSEKKEDLVEQHECLLYSSSSSSSSSSAAIATTAALGLTHTVMSTTSADNTKNRYLTKRFWLY